MKIRLVIVFCFLAQACYAQKFEAKEYSKEVALFYAKAFLYEEVLGVSERTMKFEAIPLAAAHSGELTTLLYRSDELNKEGMIFGFFGNFWNEHGVRYTGFQYKNLVKTKAQEFLEKIDRAIQDNKSFLSSNSDNNNIAFKFDDLHVIICYSGTSYLIRVFWNDFDANWEKTAFDRSKRRFEKKIR